MRARLCVAAAIASFVASASAEPVRVRFAEAASRGFLVLSRAAGGEPVAYGELLQTMRGGLVDSRLRFEWDDGSRYDERVLFSQRRTFRIRRYRIVQRGPSFREALRASFDTRTGAYRARVRDGAGKAETDAGTRDFPDDLSNGLTSVVLKNLPAGASGRTHLVSFGPEPRILDVELEPAGVDVFKVGSLRRRATRYVVRPRVTGVTGLVASAIGKQPPEILYWIAEGVVGMLMQFEGPMEMDGTAWRVRLATPQPVRTTR